MKEVIKIDHDIGRFLFHAASLSDWSSGETNRDSVQAQKIKKLTLLCFQEESELSSNASEA